MRLVIVTHFLSPYQVELFNEIARSRRVGFTAIYLHKTFEGRDWSIGELEHDAIFISDSYSSLGAAQCAVDRADLAIINYYRERPARRLLQRRARTRKPWCFWGERPGFLKPEFIGRFGRRVFLSRLHGVKAPIWGIGRFALDRYREEFGDDRLYCNVPYFSNLLRFQNDGVNRSHNDRIILFSGSLIARKGVDNLSHAFVRVAQRLQHIRLVLLGDGELRSKVESIVKPVGRQVEFLGFKDWSELPAVYRSADVLCVPSRYDGWGLVVPEALASGLPVIATTQMGAALEFVKEGTNGWLVPPEDEDRLSDALFQAATLSRVELLNMAAAARTSVAEHTLEGGAQRFIQAAYDSVQHWQD